MAHEKRAAAYIPWGTLKNQLNGLQKTGLPAQIDKTVFDGLAGGTQTQLVASMKFLGLIDEETGEPSAVLRDLVEKNELERKPVLRKVFENAYPKLFALDLKTATPQQVSDAIRENYNVTGSTLQKAMRFFLVALKDLDVELSSFLEKAAGKTSPRTNGGRRRTRKKKAPKAAPQGGGTSRSVELVSGGELTVSSTADLFALSASDREFVFGLIADLEKYEEAKPEEPQEPSDEPEQEASDEGQ